MITFKQLDLDETMQRVVSEKGFTNPTDIQQQAIPLVLEGSDLIATSSTGSGKTLAFGLGVLQQVQKGQGIQALVLAPTRELAEQISLVLKDFAKPRGLRSTAIYGGVSLNPQANALRSAEIVVATPGRLLDHMERKSIDLSCVTHVILDEADRMLDMGFLPDVKKILQACPPRRQTLLFTATLPAEVTKLAKQFMNNPQKIQSGTYVDPKKLDQVYYDVPGPMKFSLLYHLIQEEKDGLVMVFCNSRKFSDSVAHSLQEQGIDALAIHGGLTQQARKNVLKRFHHAHKFVLVCTDVAARGLDIPGVSHVYNFDIPQDPKQYVHRIGRTARAGEDGKVINLISNRDYDAFSMVLRENDLNIQKMDRPYIKKIELSPAKKPHPGQGRNPARNSSSRRPRQSHSRNNPRSSRKGSSFVKRKSKKSFGSDPKEYSSKF